MEEMTVMAVAELLGKTDRTIRNYIKEGRIKAKRIENQFGWEYRIYDLGEFSQVAADGSQPASDPPEEASETQPENKAETALEIVTQENKRLWEEFSKLRETNNRLAYDLGVRDQRIKELEQALEAVKMLPSPASNNPVDNKSTPPASPPRSWWRRLLHL